MRWRGSLVQSESGEQSHLAYGPFLPGDALATCDNLSVLRNFGREGDPNRKVLVFDDFPTVRRQKTRWQGPARVHPRPEPWRCCLPSSTVAIVTDSTKIAAVPAAPTAVANVQKSARADIPQDPKASLCRFLRRERIDVTPVKEIVEGQAWLRLGPQIANPDLSQ
uniref:Uncharacterized protein n=1 Tax=Zea mays TaxID=4577 RepID=A0A804NZF2_MAIZE